MPTKYIRDRKAIPVHFLTQLARDLRAAYQPEPPLDPVDDPCAAANHSVEDVILEPEASGSAEEICFWEHWKADMMASGSLCFHVASAKVPSLLACNVMPLDKCRPLGAGWPERGRLCDTCRRYRPEVALLEIL